MNINQQYIHTQKDVRDSIVINGQSRDTDIDIHKQNTLENGQSGMDNLETLTFTYTRKRLRDVTIRNGQSRDTDIDMHKKKTLEI